MRVKERKFCLNPNPNPNFNPNPNPNPNLTLTNPNFKRNPNPNPNLFAEVGVLLMDKLGMARPEEACDVTT